MHERRFRAGPAGRLKQVQGADRIRIEVIERNRGRAVMRRLRGGMDDGIGFDFGNKLQNALPVSNVDIVVGVVRDTAPQAVQGPACVTLGTEENGPFIVVDTKNLKAVTSQMQAHFGPDQSTGAGNERFLFHKETV